jgi:hypothetical protein
VDREIAALRWSGSPCSGSSWASASASICTTTSRSSRLYPRSSTSTAFSGSAADPVPIAAFPVDWDATVTLTEPNVAPPVLHASGSLSGTCYPAHEVSVGTTDVAEYPPYSNSTLYIAACLTAGSVSLQTIDQDIPLSLIPH